ncbi:MAG: hypothetical protein AAFX81_20010 [Pseudomonadota bacterium]
MAVAVVLGVGACTLSPMPSETMGVPGLDRQIANYYSSRAWERDASCVEPSIRILGSSVVERTADRATLDVRYSWGSGGGDRGNTCRGFGERRFTLALDGSSARVVGMTGGQRPAG